MNAAALEGAIKAAAEALHAEEMGSAEAGQLLRGIPVWHVCMGAATLVIHQTMPQPPGVVDMWCRNMARC